MLLLLFFLATQVIGNPTRSPNTQSNLFHDDQLLASIYKTCWVKCDTALGEKTSQEAIIAMISQRKINQTQFCKPYHPARQCAQACVPVDDQPKFLAPFFRRNSLAEFICNRHAISFSRYLPCYQNQTSLQFYFDHCNYFDLNQRREIVADKETCNKLDCVLRVIPDSVKRECMDESNPSYSVKAAELMHKLVSAFLEERIELTRIRNACNENSFS